MEKTNKRRKLGKLMHDCSRKLFLHSSWGIRQFEILKMLEEGPLQQKEIRETLGIQGAAASELLSKLEDKGLIERTRSEEDKRIALIQLTEKGKHAITERKKEPEYRIGKLPISDEEVDQLITLLEKLHDGIDEAERQAKEEPADAARAKRMANTEPADEARAKRMAKTEPVDAAQAECQGNLTLAEETEGDCK